MKRPNPNNGFTMGDEQKLRAEFEKRIEGIVREAERRAREKLFKELGITDLGAASTPGARWMIEAGEKTPFPDLINRERGSLCLGSYTDFELANEVFLKADMSDEEKVRNLLAGKVTPIALLTAAKERIRWLSTHLDAALSREESLIKQFAHFTSNPQPSLPMPFDEMAAVEDSDKAGLVQKRIGARGNHPDVDAEETYFTKGVVSPTAVTRDNKDGTLSVVSDKHGPSGLVLPISSLLPESAFNPPLSDAGALEMVISDAELKRKEELTKQVETLAKEIHDARKDEKGWIEWVPFGNSKEQQTARFQALGKLTEGLMKTAHVMTSNCRTDKGEPNAES